MKQANSARRGGAGADGLALLFGLWTLAVVQPLFGLLAAYPEFLILHDLTGGSLWLALVLLVLAPPLALWGLLALLVGPLRRWPRRLSVLILLGLTIFPHLEGAVGGAPWLQLIAAAASAAVFAGLLLRRRHAGFVAGLTAAAGVIFVLTFVTAKPIRSLLHPAAVEDTPPFEQLPSSRVPVVLVVLDAFPTVSLMNSAGSIDGSLCPRLAAFAGDAVWYRDALSVSSGTVWAVPAILTGKCPPPESTPGHASHPDNLFRWLAGSHSVHAFESRTRLSPSRTDSPLGVRLRLLYSDLRYLYLHRLLPDAWSRRLPPVDQDWTGFGQSDASNAPADDRELLLDGFLQAIATGDDGGIYFLHLLMPHGPFEYLPGGERYDSQWDELVGASDARSPILHEEGAQAFLQQRHLLQVGATDRILGGIVDGLKESGLYEEALVVVTADHGAAFRVGRNRRVPHPETLGELAPVGF